MGIADLGERRVQGPDEMRVGGRTGGCAGVRGSGTCRCRRCRCERLCERGRTVLAAEMRVFLPAFETSTIDLLAFPADER